MAKKTDFESELELSVVIPVYNESDIIFELFRRVTAVVSKLGLSYEIIIIDDGSSDKTWKSIIKASKNFPFIKALRLARNFGHQHALLAGLTAAKGKAIISMDGDLQHPPELFPEMINAWKSGFEIINTTRKDRKVANPFKRLTSQLFYRVFSFLTDVELSKGSSDFRLVNRKVLNEILAFRDTDLFLRGAFQWVGFRTTNISFDVEPRYSGATKFTLQKMFRFASGAIVSFSIVPLKIGIWIGIFTSILSFLELAFIFYIYTQGGTVIGWASTVGIISLLFGILFIIIGIIGIYIARIHISLQKRPQFIISEESQSNIEYDKGHR